MSISKVGHDCLNFTKLHDEIHSLTLCLLSLVFYLSVIAPQIIIFIFFLINNVNVGWYCSAKGWVIIGLGKTV